MKNKLHTLSACLLIAMASITSCNTSLDKSETSIVETEKTDSVRIVKMGTALFSVPSPVQTIQLIQSTGSGFDKSLMNPAKRAQEYSSAHIKALNIGVYGADLGYATAFDQSQDALFYMNAVKKLADGLGIATGFDKNTLTRFEQNLGVKDSLHRMVALSYQSSDAFLKNENRADVAALIIAGGWIETLWFITSIELKNHNNAVLQRIGEQKYSLDNLISLLRPYYDQPELTPLIDQLVDLAYTFDSLEVNYSYVEPSTDAASKTTTINSTSTVSITKKQAEMIKVKTEIIRNKITAL